MFEMHLISGITDGWQQGADPASKVRGGAISVIFARQVSQYGESYFQNCTKYGDKVTFVGFRRAIAPVAPPGSAPGWQGCKPSALPS